MRSRASPGLERASDSRAGQARKAAFARCCRDSPRATSRSRTSVAKLMGLVVPEAPRRRSSFLVMKRCLRSSLVHCVLLATVVLVLESTSHSQVGTGSFKPSRPRGAARAAVVIALPSMTQTCEAAWLRLDGSRLQRTLSRSPVRARLDRLRACDDNARRRNQQASASVRRATARRERPECRSATAAGLRVAEGGAEAMAVETQAPQGQSYRLRGSRP